MAEITTEKKSDKSADKGGVKLRHAVRGGTYHNRALNVRFSPEHGQEQIVPKDAAAKLLQMTYTVVDPDNQQVQSAKRFVEVEAAAA